jgi:transcription elongation GreA/GreB family factor
VISKSATKGPETTFAVNASTQKEGAVAAGATVDVRYKTEGKEKVATAISVHEAKAKTAAKK